LLWTLANQVSAYGGTPLVSINQQQFEWLKLL
jgi:hypothetical protein